jgi:Crp-like helix-turn-helix protein
MSSQRGPGRSNDRSLNNLLQHITDEDYALLAPHLEKYEFASSRIFYNPGDNVEVTYFPCEASLVSFVVSVEDGREIEVALIGREGAVGGIVSQGHLPAYTRILVQVGGPFAILPVRHLEAAKSRSASLREIFARYADCLLAQVLQSTACNAAHSIEQRAAKLILSTRERMGNEVVPLTQERLAAMLGVGRSYATRVIQTFKVDGILETRRGAMLVRKPAELEKKACLCNVAVKAHFENVLSGVYPGSLGENEKVIRS